MRSRQLLVRLGENWQAVKIKIKVTEFRASYINIAEINFFDPPPIANLTSFLSCIIVCFKV